VATGAVIYTAGRAVYTGQRFLREHLASDGDEPEGRENREDVEDRDEPDDEDDQHDDRPSPRSSSRLRFGAMDASGSPAAGRWRPCRVARFVSAPRRRGPVRACDGDAPAHTGACRVRIHAGRARVRGQPSLDLLDACAQEQQLASNGSRARGAGRGAVAGSYGIEAASRRLVVETP
jgi:hypothetical protein